MTETPMLKPGDRVTTPHGPGTVVYVRMAPPDYATVEAVSVRLVGVFRPNYVGTILPASKVAKA